MTFLNDIWKKFKSPTVDKSPSVDSGDLEMSTESLKETAEAFQENEKEYLEREQVLDNLKVLKKIVDQPKENDLNELSLRFSEINKHLGDPECHETVRQDRWKNNIQCPNCQSTHLKRLQQLASKSPHNHRYRCLDCLLEFNDDSETPLEKGAPPLNIWMQCWYLMGCTESLTYIATKLNLDLPTIEYMVRQLQKTFNAQKPLTHFLGYEDWSKQAFELRKQLKEDLLKQYELLDANVATIPKDTTEFRRQQNLRRTLSSTPEPPSSPTIGRKKR